MKQYNIKSALSVFAVAVMCAILCVFAVSTKAETSTCDEVSSEVSSVYTGSILDKANVNLGENDQVLRVDGKGCVALTILRAYDVEVNYRGKVFVAECAQGTVADAIRKAGITLTGAEIVTPALDTQLYPGCKISVSADCGATITVDGKTENYSVTVGTVKDMLEDLKITLSEDDVVIPDPDTVIYDGIVITVQRVEYKEETTTEIIDYGFVSEETSALVSGTSKIKRYGVEGEKTIVSRNKYVDGKLAESEIISEEVTREPVDQIKLIGTGKAQSGSSGSSQGGSSVSNKAGTFVDASGNTVSYTRKLTGTSTAYYAAEGSITATGTPVFVGGVAVNPNVIPYGSKLYIVSSDGSCVYGYATAVDTGGALMSGSLLVDVFYPTYSQCMNWGRRNVTVYVL